MKIDIGRREQIGIIDLAALNALVCWVERHHRSKQVTEGESCQNAENPSQSPPALIPESDNDPSGPIVGPSDRSENQATGSSNPVAGSGPIIAEIASQQGGER